MLAYLQPILHAVRPRTVSLYGGVCQLESYLLKPMIFPRWHTYALPCVILLHATCCSTCDSFASYSSAPSLREVANSKASPPTAIACVSEERVCSDLFPALRNSLKVVIAEKPTLHPRYLLVDVPTARVVSSRAFPGIYYCCPDVWEHVAVTQGRGIARQRCTFALNPRAK